MLFLYGTVPPFQDPEIPIDFMGWSNMDRLVQCKPLGMLGGWDESTEFLAYPRLIVCVVRRIFDGEMLVFSSRMRYPIFRPMYFFF